MVSKTELPAEIAAQLRSDLLRQVQLMLGPQGGRPLE